MTRGLLCIFFILCFRLLVAQDLNDLQKQSIDNELKVLIQEILDDRQLDFFIQLSATEWVEYAKVQELDGVKYIMYNPTKFLGTIYDGENRNWSSIFILAHEIGHFYISVFDKTKNELEADKFAGEVLCSLGASTDDIRDCINFFDLEGFDIPKYTRYQYSVTGCISKVPEESEIESLAERINSVRSSLQQSDYFENNIELENIEYSRYSKVGNPLASFIDSRDSLAYKIIKINNKWWFAENLKFNSESSQCAYNSDRYCTEYGRYYLFEDALSSCPQGWHLPTLGEWIELIDHYGGVYKTNTSKDLDGSLAYSALIENGSSGFNAKLSGRIYGNGGVYLPDVRGFYWVDNFQVSKESINASGILFDGRQDPRDPNRVFIQSYVIKDHYIPVRCVCN